MTSHPRRTLSGILAIALFFAGSMASHADDSTSRLLELVNPGLAAKASAISSVTSEGGKEPGLMRLATCGDAEPDPGEECDDGNLTPGDGCSATCTVEAGFDCTDAIAGSPPQNILADGSFEAGNVGGEWISIAHSLFGPNLICDDSCLGSPFAAGPNGETVSGNYVLVAGGSFSSSSTGWVVHAPVAIPPTATTLEFQWATLASGPAGDACAGAADGLRLSIAGNQVWSNLDEGPCTNVNPYERVVIDLATAPGGPYQGTTVGFEFNGSATGIPPTVDLTNVMLDDVSINIPPDPFIPPTPSVCTAIVCGDSILGSTEQCDDGNAASGDGCSASCEIEQPHFVCEDPVPPSPSGDDVTDGGFENGIDGSAWHQEGTVLEPICSQAVCGSAFAHSGAFFAWFGRSDTPSAQVLSQSVTVSPAATELSFEMLVGSCDSPGDSLVVEIDSTEVYRYDCTAITPSYEPVIVPLGGFADGNVHLVEFIAETFAVNGGSSNIFVDDISILDNTPTPGVPGVCTELPPACATTETFDSGIPATWTVINSGGNPDAGWEGSSDGICASKNWSTNEPGNNVTGGGGDAACADSDATGQIDLDTIGMAREMDSFLCSPALDLTQVTNPAFSFLVNYQAADNALNDNGTPGDSIDDFDDDFLRVLVGNEPPSALTVAGYVEVLDVVDHLDTTLALSQAAAIQANLEEYNDQDALYVCFQYRGTYAWFAQVDNAALRGSSCTAPTDTDGDGVVDSSDNCTAISNVDQRDTDGDGIGNACDADLDGDCLVNFGDLAQLKAAFFPFYDPDADLDGDGNVNFGDLAIMKATFFNGPSPGPGPGAPGNACDGASP